MPFNRRVISRQHLWLEPRSEDWLFMDNRSGNGTLIHLNSSVTLILEANRWHTIITHTTQKQEKYLLVRTSLAQTPAFLCSRAA